MLVKDLKTVLENYDHIPMSKKNKLISSKIKYIPTEAAFMEVMYKLGIHQTKRQYATLVSDINYFNDNSFIKNNTIKLSKDTVVFTDFIDEQKYKIPKGKTIDIYTRLLKMGYPSSSQKMIQIAYIMDGELLIINKIEEE